MSTRWRSALAGLASLLVLSSVVVMATRAEGREASRATSNDGGAWLVDRRSGQAAHVEYTSHQPTAMAQLADPGAAISAIQSPGVIAVYTADEASPTVKLVDGANAAVLSSTVLPAGAQVRTRPDGVAVFEPATSKLWLVPAGVMAATADLAPIPPVLQLDRSGRLLIGPSGAVAVVSDSEVLWPPDEPTGRDVTSVGLPDGFEPTLATMAGDDEVVLVDGGTWVVATRGGGSRPVSLAQPFTVQALEQEGPSWPVVGAVATDGRALAVDLLTGAVTALGPVLPGPVTGPPIFHRDCLHTLAGDPGRLELRVACLDGTTAVSPQTVSDGAQLRLVNGEVWVDELDGSGWLVTSERQVEEVADFADLFDDTDGEESADGDQVEEELNQSATEAGLVEADRLDDDEKNEPPVAVDDTAATRLGRPAVIDALANDTDPDSDVLLVSSAEVIEGAELARAEVPTTRDSVQITPTAGRGTVKVRYRITDGSPEGTAEAVITLEILPLDGDGNRAPELQLDRLTGAGGEIVTANLLANDRDPDGDSMVLTNLGTVDGVEVRSVDPGGQVVLVLPSQFSQSTLTIPYFVADEWQATAEGRLDVTIRLDGSNLAPDARNDAGSTEVGRRLVLDLLANDVDGDGDHLTIGQAPRSMAGPPPDYLDVDEEGALTFEADEPGTYILEYAVSDGSASNAAQIRIEVTAPVENRPPVAVRDDITVSRGKTRLVRALDNDGDPDGDLVSIIQQTTNPFLGVEVVQGVGFRVTLRPGSGPVETFQYQLSDGQAESEMQTVVVTRSDVEFADAAPLAVDDEARVRAGRTSRLFVLRNDVDPEGGRLTITAADGGAGIVATPAGDGQWLDVQVPPGVELPFVIQYTVQDEGGNVATAVVNVVLVLPTDPNTAPTARPDTAYTVEDAPVLIPVLANDSDPESDALRLTSVPSAPSGGSVTPADDGAGYLYRPNPGFRGTDRFTYLVSDTEGAAATGEVRVAVDRRPEQNRPPVAVPDPTLEAVAGARDVALDVLANDFDPDLDPLTIVSVQGDGASVAASGRAVLYTPPPGGEDGRKVSFRYRIADGRGGTAEAEATVTVHAALEPIPPVAVPDSHGPVKAGDEVTADVVANDLDPDGDPRQLRVTTDTPGVRVVDNKLRFTAPPATTEMAYTITDAQGLTSSSFVSIVVAGNLPPVITPIDLGPFPADEAIPAIDLSRYVTDPDGDELTFLGVSSWVGGTTSLDQGARDQRLVTFLADQDFNGLGGFSFTVEDGTYQVSGRVKIQLVGQNNRPPAGHDQSVQVEAGTDQPFDLAALFTDPDADTLTVEVSAPPQAPVELVGNPAGGSATLRVPATAPAGRTTFQVKATDPAGGTATATVTVNVTPSTVGPPVAVADTAQTNQGKAVTVDVMANDRNTLGSGSLTLSGAFADAATGSATLAGGSVTFTPAPAFFGPAQIRYTVHDQRPGPEGGAEGLLTVQVIGKPSAPTGVTAQATSATEAVLSWQAPVGNGAPIEGYRIRANGAEVATVTGASPGYRFTGGVPGTDYVFEVLAYNASGDGPYSSPSAPVRLDTTPGPPGTPTVAFAPGSPGQLTVSWADGANPGSAITGYMLEIGTCASGVRPVGVRTYTWSGLANGAACTFRVVAVNKAGDSQPSAWSRSECPADVPQAPPQPTAVRGDKQAAVRWGTPVNPDCQNPTGYEIVRYRNGSADGSTTVPYGSLAWTSAPLLNGSSYTFAVRAVNRAGPGQLSPQSAPVVPCGAPQAPPAPSATAGDQEATLSVAPADANGCPSTQRLVQVNGGAPQALPPSLRMTGLTNGQAYTFSVAEVNEAGTGAFSAPSSAVTPFGKPLVPQIRAVASGGAYTWAIDGAGPNGSPITGYSLTGNVAAFSSSPTGGTGRCVNAQGGDCLAVGGAARAPGTACLQSAATVTATGYGINQAGNGATASQSLTLSGCPGAPSLSLSADTTGFTANFSRPAGADAVYVQINGNYGPALGGTSVRQNGPAGASYSVRAWACNAFGCQASGVQNVTIIQPPPPVISLSRGVAGPIGGSFWYAVSLSGFTPGSSVTLNCYDSVNRTVSFWTQTFAIDGSGRASDTTLCYSADGPDHWVSGGGVESNHVGW
ncbi:MAG: Ig-like domain-containing protein [Acidimicrobiales bacterium]